MSGSAEIIALRQKLDALAAEPDAALTRRYVLRRPQLPKSLYWQFRRLAAATLRLLDRLGLRDGSPWPARLRHVPGSAEATPLLIWAQGLDRETLREACLKWKHRLDDLPEYAPVLVTDVADFAFFSRLGWMVEYLPEIDGEGESYGARKARLVARMYKDAPVVPAEMGLRADLAEVDVQRWIQLQDS
jgi:hypothetical protein